ncbi:MAG: hypothetical protein AB9M60_15940 [Leptothrix sp. (in: b-proteobacteria)]
MKKTLVVLLMLLGTAGANPTARGDPALRTAATRTAAATAQRVVFNLPAAQLSDGAGYGATDGPGDGSADALVAAPTPGSTRPAGQAPAGPKPMRVLLIGLAVACFIAIRRLS